jgi:hypothetical protein
MNSLIRVLAVAATLAVGACSGPRAPEAVTLPARLDRVMAEQVVFGADEALEAAMADLDSTRLDLFFAGRALRTLVDQVGWMRARSMRSEERGERRVVASWDGGANEVVIQVEAEHRLLSLDQPKPPWSSSMRQWWARLGFAAGAWRVVDDRDLPPDQWRAVTTWLGGADGLS